jgi:hypothetical protein
MAILILRAFWWKVVQPKIKQHMMAQHPTLLWRGRRDRVRLISELGAKCPPSKVRRTGDADEAFIGKKLAAMRGTKLKPKRYGILAVIYPG